jgi:putative Mg2+ transporter-C (MgtC) family protein
MTAQEGQGAPNMGSQLEFVSNKGDLMILLRLGIAALAGSIIGWNRFRAGKPAGIGTHALVALGSALFVVAPVQMVAQDPGTVTRVIQGIATGVGFLGAGEIFRDLKDPDHVHGLTSAAALWVTAALGVVAGCASIALVAAVTLLVVLIVIVSHHMEERCAPNRNNPLS